MVAKGPRPGFAAKSPKSFLSAELAIQAQAVHSLTLLQFEFSAAKRGKGAGEELGEERCPQSRASLILALLWDFTWLLLAQVIYVLQAPARTVLLSGSPSLLPTPVPVPNFLF